MLRQTRSLRRSLTRDALITTIRAIVISKVDYCNSVQAGVSGILTSRLQSVINAAAHLTCLRSTDAMPHVLAVLLVIVPFLLLALEPHETLYHRPSDYLIHYMSSVVDTKRNCFVSHTLQKLLF